MVKKKKNFGIRFRKNAKYIYVLLRQRQNGRFCFFEPTKISKTFGGPYIRPGPTCVAARAIYKTVAHEPIRDTMTAGLTRS